MVWGLGRVKGVMWGVGVPGDVTASGPEVVWGSG